MKNPGLFLVTAAALFSILTGCAAGPVPRDRGGSPELTSPDDPRKITVATVNDVPISLSALIEMMNRISGDRSGAEQTPADAAAKEALDRLVFQELAYQRARAGNIAADQRQVSEAIANFRENIGGDQAYQEYLVKEGISGDALRSRVERSLTLEVMYAREVLDRAVLSADDLQAEYARTGDRYRVPERIKIIDVAFLPQKNGNAPRRSAQAVLRSIRADKDRNPWNLVLDGTFIVRNLDAAKARDSALLDAARALRPGELSGIIRSQDGLHIIKVIESSPEHQLPLAEVRDLLEKGLKIQAQEKRLKDWKAELMTGARIEIMESAIRVRQPDSSPALSRTP